MTTKPSSSPAAKTLVVSAEAQRLAAEIARQLNEEDPIAVLQIGRLVQYLGAETAGVLLQETLEIEAGEGLLTADGEHRRTPGGVYLRLARDRVPKEDHKLIWSNLIKSFPWEDRLDLVPELLQEPGTAETVKIGLRGRPGKIIEKGKVTLTSMKATWTRPLPKGLPVLPAEPMVCLVYIPQAQWQRVKEPIQDPEDTLIISGFPAFDKRLNVMAVFAVHTTTMLLEQSRWAPGQVKSE